MTSTCPIPPWLARLEARIDRRQRERHIERRVRELTEGPLTPDTLVRILAAIGPQREGEVSP